MVLYEKLYKKRVELKPLAKKDKKIAAIVEALKLALNSCFGKFGSKTSWLYDYQTMLSITLTGELSLLMLIEEFELNGIKVISANSDGVTTTFSKDKKKIKDEIIERWLSITNFEMETVRFKSIFYHSVNSYIAVKDSGEIKRKGSYFNQSGEIPFEKNKSNLIIPYALEKYFMENIPVEDTINNCKDLSMFYARANVNSNFYLEFIEKGKKPIKYNKIVRYFVSKKGGSLIKCKSEHCTTNAAERSEVVAGQKLTIINKIQHLTELDKEKILNTVDKNFYIQECEKIIFSIQYGMKITKINKLPSLFD